MLRAVDALRRVLLVSGVALGLTAGLAGCVPEALKPAPMPARETARETAVRGPAPSGSDPRLDVCGNHIDAQTELHMGFIEQMLDQQLPRAAVAHLDAMSATHQALPGALYLRAEALRRAGDLDEALPVYRSLTATCLKGLGHHGLGRIAAARCDYAGAREALTIARQQRPIDPRIHNDLGYLDFIQGDYVAAESAFRTALELNARKRGRAATNLMMLLVTQGRLEEATALARELELPQRMISRWTPGQRPVNGCQPAVAEPGSATPAPTLAFPDPPDHSQSAGTPASSRRYLDEN